jgi:hypothetical protein
MKSRRGRTLRIWRRKEIMRKKDRRMYLKDAKRR